MRKMILISHDALVFDDLKYLSDKPAFSYLMKNGSAVETLRTIYPTITYPAHTSMISGVYPDRHGIINNELDTVGETSSPWHWFAKDHKAYTLFEAAKNAGMSTAGVFWPVTGNDPNIDYLIDEYWSQSENDDILDVFRRSGSNEKVMSIVEKNIRLLKGNERKHPEADNFVFACACDIIRDFKPDFLAIHPAAVDGARHRTGLFTNEVTRSLDDSERWTHMIIEATKQAGVFEDTDFVIMSDHGQLEIKRSINLNVLLAEKGYITKADDGAFLDWRVFIKSTAMSAQVFLKNPDDKLLADEIYALLCAWRDEGVYGINRVYTKEEIKRIERLDGGFSFVIETDGYTSFGNDWRRPLVRPVNRSDYRFGAATHGHNPDVGPQPTLIACGPSFKKGVSIARRPIVDVAPTLAKVLGVTLPDPDGQPINELIKGE